MALIKTAKGWTEWHSEETLLSLKLFLDTLGRNLETGWINLYLWFCLQVVMVIWMKMQPDQKGNGNEYASTGSDSSEPRRAVNLQHRKLNAAPKYVPGIPRFSNVWDKMKSGFYVKISRVLNVNWFNLKLYCELHIQNFVQLNPNIWMVSVNMFVYRNNIVFFVII